MGHTKRAGKQSKTGTTKIHAYLIRHFRKAWRFYSADRKACLLAAACAACKKKFVDMPAVYKTIKKKKKKVSPVVADHIVPVNDPAKGFQGWDDHYDRLFNGLLQPLCHACHKVKSSAEQKIRRKMKKQKEGKGG